MTSAVARIALAFVLSVTAFVAGAATIWTGPRITFNKDGSALPGQPGTIDAITSKVWITRGSTQGLYNAVIESGYSPGSPAGTEWAYGTTANLTNLVFQPWVTWAGKQPPGTVGRDAVLHLVGDDIYIDIKFTDWGSRGEGSFGYIRSTPAVVTPPPPPPPNTVVEFYNSILDHYFITANASEVSAIDSGSAGPGWSRTGDTFKAGGDTPVCRFYGSLSPGPNSHFYTADANECAALKQLQATTPSTERRWNFESNDFLTTPAVNRACAAGLVPVFRAYNNGFARNIDSDHRITSNAASIQAVVARGWLDEGIVMCAPQ